MGPARVRRMGPGDNSLVRQELAPGSPAPGGSGPLETAGSGSGESPLSWRRRHSRSDLWNRTDLPGRIVFGPFVVRSGLPPPHRTSAVTRAVPGQPVARGGTRWPSQAAGWEDRDSRGKCPDVSVSPQGRPPPVPEGDPGRRPRLSQQCHCHPDACVPVRRARGPYLPRGRTHRTARSRGSRKRTGFTVERRSVAAPLARSGGSPCPDCPACGRRRKPPVTRAGAPKPAPVTGRVSARARRGRSGAGPAEPPAGEYPEGDSRRSGQVPAGAEATFPEDGRFFSVRS